VCAADFIAHESHAGLYRVHEGPTPEKREALQAYLRTLGLGLSLSAEPRPAEFQALASATRERPDAVQIHSMLLRSMQQAVYTPVNSGHFGLAYTAYTHFTSPIRRYPDLLTHRVIKALLRGKRYTLHNPDVPMPVHTSRRAPTQAAKPAGSSLEKARSTDAWASAGLHCSAAERRADEASRDVEAWLKCRFMREHLGEEFRGTITAVAGFGVFVTLDALYVEGLVHISELGGDYFQFDDVRQELRGERTGMRFGIGSKLVVQVSRVDLDGRRVEFRLVPEVNGTATRPGGLEDAGRSAVAKLAAVEKAVHSRKREAKLAKSEGAPRKRAGTQRAKASAGRKGAAAATKSTTPQSATAKGKARAGR
jgi:ribonuclease R